MADQIERDAWLKVAKVSDSFGEMASWFYKRARAVADGEPDPMSNVNQLMSDSSKVDQ
jgi:hypothetical protein